MLKRLILLALFASIACSCASYTEDTKKVRSSFLVGQYHKALQELEGSSIKDEKVSALLYHLEKSMILDRMGELEKSRKELFKADRIVDKLFTVSVSNTAASFIVNERAQDYEGEDYEKIAIHTMLALSFLQEQNFNSALVQARKINNKLYEIVQDYDKDHRSYAEDAFARYLAGMIHHARGSIDDAIIDYKKALNLYESSSYKKFYLGSVPGGLVSSLYSLALKRGRKKILVRLTKDYKDLLTKYEKTKKDKNFGELVVIHELGNVEIKRAKEFVVNFGKQIVRFSFPYIRNDRHYKRGATGIQLADGTFFQASNVADLNAIAYNCLEDRRGRLLLKGAARLLAKGQLTEQAYQNFGVLGGIAANIVTAATETADTRSWTLLPEAFYVSKVILPVGEHALKFKSNGKTVDIVKVKVKKGQFSILRASS